MHAAVSSTFSPKRVHVSGFVYRITGSLPGVANGSKGALSFFPKTYDNTNTTAIRNLFSSAAINVNTTGAEYLSITLTNGANLLSAVSATWKLLAANAATFHRR